MARKQMGAAAARPEDAATRAFVVANAGGGGTLQKLNADSVSNGTTLTTGTPVMSDLSAYLDVGFTYSFEFFLVYTTTATTVGARWTINGPAFTLLAYRSEYSLTATSRTFNEGLAAYNLPAAANGTSAALTGNIARIEGVITPSASGALVPYFASETAAAITVKAGSYVTFRALPNPVPPPGGGTQHSIWGTGAYPWTLTKSTDTALTVGTQFYSYGSTPDVSAWRVVGAKLWVPAGVTFSGTLAFKAWNRGSTASPATLNLGAAGTVSGTMSSFTAGAWNSVMFNAPLETNSGDLVAIAYYSSTGEYLGFSPASPGEFIAALDGSHIVQAESSAPNWSRSYYRMDSNGTTVETQQAVYGIDAIYDEGP